MRKNPSTRWFFQDWFNDKALRASSPAARGMWMDMLCICAENDGYLLIDGKKASLNALSNLFGVPNRTARRLVAELEYNGVFSRDGNGVIFNRRMARNMDETSRAPNPPAHDAHAPTSPPHAPNSTSSILQESTPLPPSKGVFEKAARKRNRSPAYNHNGVTEHTPSAGPLVDPVELAIKLGIRSPDGKFIQPPR